jgi:vancomycin aglycone glucosyltransferase
VQWEQDAQRVNGLYGEALNQHRAAIGLPPVDNVRDHVLTDQPWLAADATLCPSHGMTRPPVPVGKPLVSHLCHRVDPAQSWLSRA